MEEKKTMKTFLSMGLPFIVAAGAGRDCSCSSRKPLGPAPIAHL